MLKVIVKGEFKYLFSHLFLVTRLWLRARCLHYRCNRLWFLANLQHQKVPRKERWYKCKLDMRWLCEVGPCWRDSNPQRHRVHVLWTCVRCCQHVCEQTVAPTWNPPPLLPLKGKTKGNISFCFSREAGAWDAFIPFAECKQKAFRQNSWLFYFPLGFSFTALILLIIPDSVGLTGFTFVFLKVVFWIQKKCKSNQAQMSDVRVWEQWMADQIFIRLNEICQCLKFKIEIQWNIIQNLFRFG